MAYYKIADLYVQMNTFGRTRKQSEPYLTEKNCFDIAIPDGTAPELLSPEADSREYARTCSFFYRQLIDFDGMVLHASCVVAGGKAFLFSAPCGTGKSTHTALWLRQWPEAYILNDDKPALRFTDGCFFVYGTPWSGKTDQNRNEKVPLGGIGILNRGENNRVIRLTEKEGFYPLLDQTLRPSDPCRMGRLLKNLDRLLRTEKIFRVWVNQSPEAAVTVRTAMEGYHEA